MQKKRTGRMLCSLALSAVTLWGVSVTAPAKDARDALRSLKDETLGVMLLRYERGDGGEDFLSLRTSLALHATPLLREGEENIAQAWSAELEQKPDDSADETGDAQDNEGTVLTQEETPDEIAVTENGSPARTLKASDPSGYTVFGNVYINNGSDAGNGAASAKLNYTNAAFIYKIGPFTVNIFLFIGIILLICSYVFLFKTKWGLRLRACGEHPQAADSVGINVYQWRYTGVIISGALGGIGGFAYIVPSVTTWNFEVGVAGAGFLALAVMIFGQWKPFHIAGAAVFFAVFRSLANIADSTVLSHLGLSKNIYSMMPFIASMIILAFTSKNSQAPKAEGIPYDKGAR